MRDIAVRLVSEYGVKGLYMTTESHAEPYMAQLDGHLMCNLVGANQVPLCSAIYGGYTQTFGRSGEVGNPTAFRMEHGQAFAFGEMLRPPELQGDTPTVGMQWKSKTSDYVEMEAVQRSAWRAPDGRIGLFFTNVSDAPVRLNHTFDLRDFGWEPTRRTHDVNIDIVTVNGDEDVEPELDTGTERPYRLQHTLQAMESIAVVISIE